MEQVSIDLAKCTGCGVCAAICPYRAIGMTAGRAEHDGQACFRPEVGRKPARPRIIRSADKEG